MNPFKQFTHGGTLSVSELLFRTQFNYMFPLLAAKPECLLPPGATTQGALLSLGTAMASDPGTAAGDSTIPAVFTYLGQFIDHNITAQTDREIGMSRIATPDGVVMDLTPLPPSEVVHQLVNGRRPKLDLNQVYGDGPGLGTNPSPTEGDALFDPATLHFKVVADAPGFDVPRQNDGTAIIADMRNNENLNVSQLHCAFLVFHNKVAAGLPGGSKDERYIRARQLVRWAYQYIVLHDYLSNVCDPVVVNDVAANGVRYYAPDNDLLFMPLEFSVAAFRFGHSMIRSQYKINGAAPLTLAEILGVGALLTPGAPKKLKAANIIEWHNFAHIGGSFAAPQMARKIDPLISPALGSLPVTLPGSTMPIGALLQHLARRNLLRGFRLSIPTGQALTIGMQVKALTQAELRGTPGTPIHAAVVGGGFDVATPLWYYILREAEVQQGGNRLGSVGSRCVAETLTALVRRDGASYANNRQDPAVKPNGIDVNGTIIATIADLLKFSGTPL